MEAKDKIKNKKINEAIWTFFIDQILVKYLVVIFPPTLCPYTIKLFISTIY